MQPLNVAFDMTFANRNRGGSMVYARSLFASLRERPEVVAWTIAGPQRSNFAGTMHWLLDDARRHLEDRRPDVLHCPTFVTPWRIRVPIVVTAHDAAARRFPEDHPLEWTVYDRRLMPARLRAAARVIAVSDFARREVVDVYGVDPAKVVVVPNGLDARFLAQPLEAEVVVKRGPLLFPGAPIGRKNLDAVLRCMAAAGAEAALSRVNLEISGAEARAFPRYARMVEELGLATRVRWLGQLPDDEMAGAIRRAAAVVYPSLYEGFGFPPLEAMALGTPVVASNRGSLPEVLDNAAVIVDPTDGRALAGALEAVLTRAELREELRSKGWSWAQRFTWTRCAELTEEVYRGVLAEHRVAA